MFSTLHITRAEPKILNNSWNLRSDQDGGSGGHLSGQRRVQVSEEATGDLLVFVFVNIPLKLSQFFESESLLTTFCVIVFNHLQFLIRIRAD